MKLFSQAATDERVFRNFVLDTFKVLLGFGLFAVLTHISWNMFAPDLLGLPETRMKGAMGLVLFAGTLSWVLRSGFGRRRHGHASES